MGTVGQQAPLMGGMGLQNIQGSNYQNYGGQQFSQMNQGMQGGQQFSQVNQGMQGGQQFSQMNQGMQGGQGGQQFSQMNQGQFFPQQGGQFSQVQQFMGGNTQGYSPMNQGQQQFAQGTPDFSNTQGYSAQNSYASQPRITSTINGMPTNQSPLNARFPVQNLGRTSAPNFNPAQSSFNPSSLLSSLNMQGQNKPLPSAPIIPVRPLPISGDGPSVDEIMRKADEIMNKARGTQ